jgi:hypothetical protein
MKTLMSRFEEFTMFLIRWLTAQPKGRQAAGTLLFLGIVWLVPVIFQIAGFLPRSTDMGPMLGLIALASLIAGTVELLPRSQHVVVVAGRLLALMALTAVVLWGIVKMM